MHIPGGTAPLSLSWYDLLSWDTISETPCVAQVVGVPLSR